MKMRTQFLKTLGLLVLAASGALAGIYLLTCSALNLKGMHLGLTLTLVVITVTLFDLGWAVLEALFLNLLLSSAQTVELAIFRDRHSSLNF